MYKMTKIDPITREITVKDTPPLRVTFPEGNSSMIVVRDLAGIYLFAVKQRGSGVEAILEAMAAYTVKNSLFENQAMGLAKGINAARLALLRHETASRIVPVQEQIFGQQVIPAIIQRLHNQNVVCESIYATDEDHVLLDVMREQFAKVLSAVPENTIDGKLVVTVDEFSADNLRICDFPVGAVVVASGYRCHHIGEGRCIVVRELTGYSVPGTSMPYFLYPLLGRSLPEDM